MLHRTLGLSLLLNSIFSAIFIAARELLGRPLHFFFFYDSVSKYTEYKRA